MTPEGRAIGIALMIAGIGLFGTFTAYLAKWFVESESSDEALTVSSEIRSLRAEIELLRRDLGADRLLPRH